MTTADTPAPDAPPPAPPAGDPPPPAAPPADKAGLMAWLEDALRELGVTKGAETPPPATAPAASTPPPPAAPASTADLATLVRQIMDDRDRDDLVGQLAADVKALKDGSGPRKRKWGSFIVGDVFGGQR